MQDLLSNALLQQLPVVCWKPAVVVLVQDQVYHKLANALPAIFLKDIADVADMWEIAVVVRALDEELEEFLHEVCALVSDGKD